MPKSTLLVRTEPSLNSGLLNPDPGAFFRGVLYVLLREATPVQFADP